MTCGRRSEGCTTGTPAFSQVLKIKEIAKAKSLIQKALSGE